MQSSLKTIRLTGIRIHNSRFVRNVAFLVSGTAAGQLVIVLASPVLTRLYTPKEFGLLAVFYAVLGIVAVIASFRYELAIPLPRRDRNAAHVLFLAIVINALMVLISILLVVGAKEYIAKWTRTPQVCSYLWLLPVGVAFFGVNKVFSYWATRKKEFKTLARTRLCQSIGTVGVQVGTGLAHLGVVGLILGQIVGQAVGLLSLVAMVRRNHARIFEKICLKRIYAAARRYCRFPQFDSPAALLNVTSEQLPAFLLATLFSPAVAGYYLLAYRVLSIPVAFIGQAVAQVLYAEASLAGRDGRLGTLVGKIIKTLTVVAILPALVVCFFAPSLFSIIFGETWRTAGVYAVWMMMGISAQFVYSPISLIFLATKGQYLNLIFHAILLTLRIIAIVFGWLHRSSLIAIIGFSSVSFFSYFLGSILIFLRARNAHQYL